MGTVAKHQGLSSTGPWRTGHPPGTLDASSLVAHTTKAPKRTEAVMSDLDVPRATFAAIEREIASETSPVGIDAKKTHVIILHKLQEIEARLRRIEAALEQ